MIAMPLIEGSIVSLRATSKTFDKGNRKLIFGTDWLVEIPEGCIGIITPLDSLSSTLLQFLDNEYLKSGTHEIKVSFGPGPRPKKNYEVGDLIALLKVVKE